MGDNKYQMAILNYNIISALHLIEPVPVYNVSAPFPHMKSTFKTDTPSNIFVGRPEHVNTKK
jgi:hypothetical protein